MSNLIVFGGSVPYGQGLSDCYDTLTTVGDEPSKYAWPSILAKRLNLTCINCSYPGASNFLICNNILNYQFSSIDTVFVDWTFVDRDTVFNNDFTTEFIAPWANKKLFKHWMLTHSRSDCIIRNWTTIYTAWLHLRSLDIKFYFTMAEDEPDMFEHRPAWTLPVNFLTTRSQILRNHFPKGLDNHHPGEDCHQLIAYSIYNELHTKTPVEYTYELIDHYKEILNDIRT